MSKSVIMSHVFPILTIQSELKSEWTVFKDNAETINHNISKMKIELNRLHNRLDGGL